MSAMVSQVAKSGVWNSGDMYSHSLKWARVCGDVRNNPPGPVSFNAQFVFVAVVIAVVVVAVAVVVIAAIAVVAVVVADVADVPRFCRLIIHLAL